MGEHLASWQPGSAVRTQHHLYNHASALPFLHAANEHTSLLPVCSPPEGLALPKVCQHHPEGGALAGRRPEVRVAHACKHRQARVPISRAMGEQRQQQMMHKLASQAPGFVPNPGPNQPTALHCRQLNHGHPFETSPGSGSSRQLSHFRSKCTMPRSSKAPTAAATCGEGTQGVHCWVGKLLAGVQEGECTPTAGRALHSAMVDGLARNAQTDAHLSKDGIVEPQLVGGGGVRNA